MRTIIFLLTLILAGTSCKKKEQFTEPETVLRKWMRAVKNLNYHAYRECEAYPKSRELFREMYKEYYLADIFMGKIEDLDRKEIKKDASDNRYLKRNVSFTVKSVSRKKEKTGFIIRGDVDFVRFLEGKLRDDGWLMSNRTLIRISNERQDFK
jgi:hypothetical protein